jgi:TonB-linked SusC/RagA family outer membrane protein
MNVKNSSLLNRWQGIRHLLLLGLSLFLTSGLLAQGQITGKVTNSEGSPLVGAAVLLKGSTKGALTGDDGGFSIQASVGDVLVVSYLGYTTIEVPVTGSTVSVTMQEDAFSLTEVVVTGYATQRKEDLTGSVSVIKPQDLTAIPTSNVANQLQGRAAGVNVVQDGRPGSPTKVRIRGFGSFLNNDPLYVVDGIPTQDISTLNPNDIESLTVLKDAGAASIYGSRASNGVVVITTKRGTEGVNVNYSMFYGTQNPGVGPTNLLNAQQYADLQWLVYDNDGISETHPIYGPSSAAAPTFPSWAADTKWWEEITNNAPIQSHDVSLSGGNKNARFFTAFNYFDQQGVVIETYTKRISGRVNSEFKIKDRVTIGENITFTHSKNGRGVGNLDEGSPIIDVYRNQPIIPVYMTQAVDGLTHDFEPGDFGGTGIAPRLGNSSNPVANAIRDADDFGFSIRLLASTYADVKIVEGLNFRSTFGGTFGMNHYNDYTFATYERSENVGTAAFQEGSGYGGDWVWTNTLTFDKDFGVHSILGVAGYEAVKYGMGRSVYGRRAGYFSDAVSFRTLQNGATIVNTESFVGTPTSLVSNFVRLDYGYDNRYLLSATVRRDGASGFGEDNRFGIFPSVTAAWRIGQEEFLRNNKIVSDLKIRGGYGTMGNQLALSPVNRFFLYGGDAGTSFYDLNGTGNSSLQGFRPTRIGNPDAKWETNVTSNIGFDAAFFDNRLEVVFDYYTKTNQDLLFNPELPGTAGAAEVPFVNIAEMRNQGIDLQLIYRNTFANDFRIEGNLTFTTYDNEIVKVAESTDFFDWGGSRIGPFNRNQAGNPLSSFFGYQVVGLWQTQAEIDAADALDGNALTDFQDGAEPGFFRYADIAGPLDDNGNPTGPDGVVDQNDRTFIGNPNPDFTYGFNLNLGYKNFDLTAFFFGSQGNEIFNYTKWWVDFWPSFQGNKSIDLLNNSWTESNTSATVPKASNKSNFSTNTQSSSYYIEDGSFLRLRNLQLGYTFDKEVISKVGMSSARVYVQGTNLFTLTQYSGVDPELGGDDRSFGVDAGNYPVVKQFLFGVNFGF